MKERNKIRDFSRRLLAVIVVVSVMAGSVNILVYASESEKTTVKDTMLGDELKKVDKGGIAGTTVGAHFVIDRTKPVITTASITPNATTSYTKTLPTLTWSVNEKYISYVQVLVNNQVVKTINGVTSGKDTITGLKSGVKNKIKEKAVENQSFEEVKDETDIDDKFLKK